MKALVLSTLAVSSAVLVATPAGSCVLSSSAPFSSNWLASRLDVKPSGIEICKRELCGENQPPPEAAATYVTGKISPATPFTRDRRLA